MRERLLKSSTTAVCAIPVFMTMMASAVIAAAQPHGYIVLHRFNGGDGASPLAPLALDSGGNPYSTTSNGGDLNCNSPYGCGTVYQLSVSGGFKLLHTFTGAPDGASPAAGVIVGSGAIFGTTFSGGAACQPGGCGTVYEVGPTGQEKVLYSFAGGSSDGAGPAGSLYRDAGGNLVGTTDNGGENNVFGTAFELDPSGAETILHFFAQSPDGAFPAAGFVSDAAGNLISTTALGGSTNNSCMGVGCGTVFELRPNGTGGWNESVIYSFLGQPDGLQPRGNLVKDANGNLYGVTAGGGSSNCGNFGCGTVFKLTPAAGGGWTESVLYAFSGAADGANPDSLVRDSQGNLYGATTGSGKFSHGTLFALSPSSQFKVLHSFTGGGDGAGPQVGLLIEQPQTIIFGATAGGGNPSCSTTNGSGCGVLFAYAP